MEYDFLKQFSKRMKIVGMFSTLIKNSWQKTTWKQFGFETMDEQVNMIYAVLLFIMEYSHSGSSLVRLMIYQSLLMMYVTGI